MARRSKMSSITRLEDVTQIMRVGIGAVYRAVISLADLATYLRRATVRYSPLYQRGFSDRMVDVEEWKYATLLPLDHPELQIKPERANAMAVKFLQGRLYTTSVVWNARQEEGVPAPKFDEGTATLELQNVITVPDTAHRHLAYLTLVRWHEDANTVPVEVIVDDVPVSEDDIRRLLVGFDPEEHYVHVDIYNLRAEQEGHLYDEFNADAKKPSTAVELDLNRTKTPARRFMTALMTRSDIFSRDEVETRRNTIGSKSRKLVTNAAIESAVRVMKRDLIKYERDSDVYDDLLDFVAAFFEEYAKGYPAWQPNAHADARHALRKESFALSNIIIFPLMRLAFDLWKEYQATGVDWQDDQVWKEAVAKITGSTTAKDPDQKQLYRGPVLGRDNPEWKGRVLVRGYDRNGNLQFTLSSTRQTREAAYQYLRQVAGLSTAGEPAKAA